MLHRSLVAAGGVLAALALASPALAVRVHVRVEGVTKTLWGKTGPLVKPVSSSFRPPDGPRVDVSKPTPFGALEAASRIGELYYRVRSTSFGPYVDRIGRRIAAGANGWVFKVNNASPPVGAAALRLRAGDQVLWYWAHFGPNGGPKTLGLVRAGKGCFRAVAYDDNGTRSRPRNVVFRVNQHDRASVSGRFCPPADWKTLRVKKDGMVRSAVRVH